MGFQFLKSYFLVGLILAMPGWAYARTCPIQPGSKMSFCLRKMVCVAGPTGPTGAMGGMGEMGTQGPQGVMGEQGNLGPVGPAGRTGDPGPVGLTGPTGPTGSPGLAPVFATQEFTSPGLNNGETITGSVTCSGPVTSGGYSLVGTRLGDQEKLIPFVNAPSDGNTWTVIMAANANVQAFTLTVFAGCL